MTLTRREAQILGFVANGKTQPKIAEILNMSGNTVNFHLDRVREKLGATNTANAVAIAIRDNLII